MLEFCWSLIFTGFFHVIFIIVSHLQLKILKISRGCFRVKKSPLSKWGQVQSFSCENDETQVKSFSNQKHCAYLLNKGPGHFQNGLLVRMATIIAKTRNN